MKRTAVINVVGLTESLVGPSTPHVAEFLKQGAKVNIIPAFPAVTCTAQSTFLTGQTATEHGIVGNGWYNRELAEVQFWKQSNHLVQGRRLWEELREHDPEFTCAKLFWWFNMYSSVDYSVTPRPVYPADGRKIFDIYTWPYSIRAQIKKDLGEFPFPCFWGPAAGVDSPQGPADAASRWIAESAKWIEKRYHPTLSLIYLPHLDYNLQRQGPFAETETGRFQHATAASGGARRTSRPANPAILSDLRAIDNIVGDLIAFFEKQSVQVILLSEYGIIPVNWPIHLNRLFRTERWIAVKEELGLELLDCGASQVFAVADHQVAHIYLNDPSLENRVRSLLEKTEGVEAVLGTKEKIAAGIGHSRAGDLIAVAKENAWFTYYFWVDDHLAPDFARTVDIHRKPGYDPVELFLDPAQRLMKLKIARRLLRKKLGFRMLLDVIPLDATLVKGSHGRVPTNVADYPVLISRQARLLPESPVAATEVYHLLRRHLLV